MKLAIRSWALAATILFFTSAASATVIPLSASLDCAQAAAGAGTCGAGGSGTGSATITFDDVSNVLTWNVVWSGLSTPTIAAHFHGPATPDQDAGVQIDIGIISPAVGNQVITPIQAADLLAGLWYLNVHSVTFQGGEIRGQVIPEPGTLLLFAMGVGGLAVYDRRRRR